MFPGPGQYNRRFWSSGRVFVLFLIVAPTGIFLFHVSFATCSGILPATQPSVRAASQAPEAARSRAAGSLGPRSGYGGGLNNFSGTSKPRMKVAIAQAGRLHPARRRAISRIL